MGIETKQIAGKLETLLSCQLEVIRRRMPWSLKVQPSTRSEVMHYCRSTTRKITTVNGIISIVNGATL